jgi:hypothetical protein
VNRSEISDLRFEILEGVSFVNLHSLRPFHSGLLHPDSGDSAATGQSGRRRAVLELAVEHRVRSARHRESFGEDHDWCCGSVHADRVDARPACRDWVALSARVDTSARCQPEPIADRGTGSIGSARDVFAGIASARAGSITRSDEVAAFCSR